MAKYTARMWCAIFGFRRRTQSSDNSNKNAQDKLKIPANILECMELIKNIFGNSSDLVARKFTTAKEEALVVYIDGLTNLDLIQRDIISPLKSEKFEGNLTLAFESTYKVTDDMHELIEKVLSGETALFYGSSKKGFLFEFRGWQHRAIEEPSSETVIRGPKEGFIENISTNTAMIRRKIKTPDLRFESMSIGRQTRTQVTLVYVEGIVNKEILRELKDRLSKISTDIIMETGEIEQYIDKNTFSPVSGIGVTQKPDKLAHNILEGRVAILVDGTPHALLVPELFMDNLHTSEDYYNRTIYTNFLRIIRGVGLFITVLIPGLSVAVFTYDLEMLPSSFLQTIIGSTLLTPMSISAEIFIMMAMFELVKEAGTRLPKEVGSAVTIVGSLIIGDTAVKAGLVSSASIIIVAIAAISSFMITGLTEYIMLYRLFFWIFGSTMGLVGIGAGLMIMMTQLISTESFGIPILSAFTKNEMKDSLFRFPLKTLRYRPDSIANDNIKRR